MESLTLEGEPGAWYYSWETECRQGFQEVKRWLQNCGSLRVLELMHVPDSPTIVSAVLSTPKTCLTTLRIDTDEIEHLEFYTSISLQPKLQSLVVRTDDHLDVSEARSSAFADAICKCPTLLELITDELFTLQELSNICYSVPLLESIGLNGEAMDHGYFTPLLELSKLKMLTFYGPSNISPTQLLDFLEVIGEDSNGSHEKLQVSLERQERMWIFSPDSEDAAKVAEVIRDRFGGRFKVNYVEDDSSD